MRLKPLVHIFSNTSRKIPPLFNRTRCFASSLLLCCASAGVLLRSSSHTHTHRRAGRLLVSCPPPACFCCCCWPLALLPSPCRFCFSHAWLSRSHGQNCPLFASENCAFRRRRGAARPTCLLCPLCWCCLPLPRTRSVRRARACARPMRCRACFRPGVKNKHTASRA